MDQLDIIKIKNFSFLKVHMKQIKRQATDREKIFANLMSNKRLVPRLYKELPELNSKKLNSPIKKWGKKILKRRYQW